MKNRKIVNVLLFALLISSLLMLQSCGKCRHKYENGSSICSKCESPCNHTEINYKRICDECGNPIASEGLEFETNYDGTCTLISMGSCKDKYVVIPSESEDGDIVVDISSNAFAHYFYTMLTSQVISVTIPETVNKIPINAFYACSSLQTITVNENNLYFKSNDGVLYTKDGTKLLKYPTAKKNTNFEVPNGVEVIDRDSFERVYDLESVVLPEGLKSIYSAFKECKQLKSINIPSSVTYIDGTAFYECENIIQKENGIHYVDTWVVNADTDIQTITLRDNTVGFAEYAFSGCNNLTGYTVPENIKHISGSAFRDCANLTYLNIHSGVIDIGYCLTGNSTKLTAITVDEENPNYKTIDGNLYTKDGKTLIQYAAGKTDEKFTVPNDVKTIKHYAFLGASNLKSITMSNNVTSIEYGAFYNCKGLTSLTLPNGITKIASYTFGHCENLETVIIPTSVTLIETEAFIECLDFKTVFIPKSVTVVEEDAFSKCTNLRVCCEAESEPVGWDYYWHRGLPLGVYWGYKNN